MNLPDRHRAQTRCPITADRTDIAVFDPARRDQGRPGPDWYFSGNAGEGGTGAWLRIAGRHGELPRRWPLPPRMHLRMLAGRELR